MKMADLLRTHAVPFHDGQGDKHARPGWLQLRCPFCAHGDKKHLGYNTNGNYWNCYKCGPHRSVEVLKELLNLPAGKCFELAGGIDFAKFTKMRPAGKLVLPPNIGPMLTAHRQYLKGRGLKPGVMERLWGFQGIGRSTSLAWRIFIPIHYQGEVVSWTTRTIGERGLRYRSAGLDDERMPHKELLYGEDYCRHTIVVCEGPLDACKIGPGAVATLGTGYSRAQLEKMTHYLRRVILFDAEPEAQERAKKLVRELESFPGETYRVVLESGKDAIRADDEEILELREKFLAA